MKKIAILFSVLILGLSSQALAQRSFDYPAAPLFSNVLQTLRIDSRDKLNLEPIYVYFLPSDKGKVRVMKDGKELTHFTWLATVGDGSGNLFKIADYMQKGVNPDGFTLTSGGNYELVYEANGKVFYKFPFRLEKSSEDEYSSNSDWVIRCDIENYVYLIESRGEWYFKFYLRGNAGQRQFGYIEFFKDGKKIGFSRTEKMGLVTQKNWKRFEYSVRKPLYYRTGTNGQKLQRGGEKLNLKTLSDGTYTIKFTLNGKPHGTYKFDMKGGEIQMQDRQKEGTNPLRYIEGGGAVFWLKKI